MTQWCESCGHMVHDPAASHANTGGSSHGDGLVLPHVDSGATWIGEPGDEPERPFSKPAGERAGIEKKLVGAMLGLVVLWGAFVGVGRLLSPDQSIDSGAAAQLEEERIEREVERALEEAERQRQEQLEEAQAREAAAEAEARAAAAVEDPPVVEAGEGDYAAADAAPGIPTEDERQSTQVVGIVEPGGEAIVEPRGTTSEPAKRLSRQLTQRNSNTFAAYESAIGVVLIDLTTAQSWVFEAPAELSTPGVASPLLRARATTYAFDTERLQLSIVGADAGLIVSDTLDGATHFVDPKTLNGQASIIEVIDNGEYSFHRVPTTAFQLQAIDGVGLVALPKEQTGETLVSGAQGFDVLSPNPVLTGSAGGLLEQVCDDEGRCTLVVSSLEDEASSRRTIPATFSNFGDQYALSPSGDALLRFTNAGYGEILFVDSQALAWVAGAGIEAPVWGPNSEFVAWIELLDEPKLKVMFTDDRAWLTVNLWDYGVPRPTSPNLLLFDRASTEDHP